MRRLLVLSLAAILSAGAVAALPGMSPSLRPGVAQPPQGLPGQLRDVAYEQRLGESIPMDATFRDESGRTVRLGDLLNGRPAVLALVYYGCPMLCGMTLQGLVGALEAVKFVPGRDFEVIVASFDPRETPDLAQKKKTNALKAYGGPETAAGWHFLTGDEPEIHRLTEAVGFRYVWDEAAEQYAHAAGIVVVTPDGRLARYFYGIEFPPKDLRLGLVEAGGGRIGNFVDQALLYCFHYDPSTGKYSAAVIRIVRVGGLLLLVLLAGFFLASARHGRARRTATVGS